MKRYHASGKVYPESVQLNWSEIATIADRGGANVGLKISIVDSQIAVIADCPDELDTPTLHSVVTTFADSVVSLVGFFYCQAPYAQIDKIREEGSEEPAFESTADNLVFEGGTAFGDKITFLKLAAQFEIWPHILSDHFIVRAMYELRQSSRQKDYTALHCRLAIESIRNAFLPETGKISKSVEQEAWKKCGEALNLTQLASEIGKDAADDQRHGRNRPQTWPERQQAMQAAWEVVWRYINYAFGGKIPLSKDQFPTF